MWTRNGRRTVPHDRRDLSDRESQRWIATALAAKRLLAKAAMVTVIGDRESDIFALYASAAWMKASTFSSARSMHDRKLCRRHRLECDHRCKDRGGSAPDRAARVVG